MTRFPATLVLALFVCAGLVSRPQAADVDDNDDEPPGVTVLQRGPVHEAFAQPVNPKPEPGAVVPKKPPAPIAEVPPDQKPKGQDVAWIGGYWAWDMEKKDFIWVSGLWRVPPPGRKWVPGYWTEVDDGWQWIGGFWASAKSDELRYTDPPPASLDNGPNTPAADEDSSWVPGTWLWRDGAWVWRPGYWAANYPGWTYTPPGYAWTPNGCVLIDGYWDYSLEDRGMLFAPVCFAQPFGQTYTPRCVVGCGGLLNNLFFGPGCGSYWFGNCYGPFWRACGFTAWAQRGPRCFDPLWSHASWANRSNPGWARNLQANVRNLNNGVAAGPPAAFSAQRQGGVAGGSVGHHNALVTPLSKVAKSTPLTPVSAAQREQARQAATQVRNAGVQRGRSETHQAATSRQAARTLSLPTHLQGNNAVPRSGNAAPRVAANNPAPALQPRPQAALNQNPPRAPIQNAPTPRTQATPAPIVRSLPGANAGVQQTPPPVVRSLPQAGPSNNQMQQRNLVPQAARPNLGSFGTPGRIGPSPSYGGGRPGGMPSGGGRSFGGGGRGGGGRP